MNGVSQKDRGVVLLKWILYAEGLGSATSNLNANDLIDVYRTLDDGKRGWLDLKDSQFVENFLSGAYKHSKVREKMRKGTE